MAKFEADMILPPNGKKIWTEYIMGEREVPKGVSRGEPIVMARAVFDDGTWAVAGVANSGEQDYNLKFLWIFDAEDRQIAHVADVSNHEDFEHSSYSISLNDEDFPGIARNGHYGTTWYDMV